MHHYYGFQGTVVRIHELFGMAIQAFRFLALCGAHTRLVLRFQLPTNPSLCIIRSADQSKDTDEDLLRASPALFLPFSLSDVKAL